MNQLSKYLIAGLVNTVVGYGVFWISLRWANYSPETANAIGYAFGLLVAFLLNRFFVFVAASSTIFTVIRFIFAFAIAFAINQATLYFCFRILMIPAEIAQIIAMVSYTITFYLLNKYYAFKLANAIIH